VKTNRVQIIKIKPKALQFQARDKAGKLWTDLVKLHKFIRKRGFENPENWKWPTEPTFKNHFKGKYDLHSQTIQAIIEKFFANLDTIRILRKNGDKKARYPFRYRRQYNPIFKGQAIRLFGNRIRLPLKNKKYLWYTIPENEGKIVQAELGFDKLFLTIQKEIDVPEQTSNKISSLDFGIIHTAVITDGMNSLAIVGRGIRSIKQGQAKQLSKLSRKLSKTKKGSKRRRKLIRAKFKLIDRKNNLLRNAFHQVSRQIVNWCVANDVATLVVGDLENINKGTKKKRRRQNNQEIGKMEFGTLYAYLGYKLKEKGIEIKKIKESYTSQTCPQCGNKKKPSGRVYKCTCGFVGIRDLVGAFNIRNLWINKEIKHNFSKPSRSLKYLRPIQIKSGGRSSRSLAQTKVA